jgi:hypothetical protein
MIKYTQYIDLFPKQVSLTHKGGQKYRNNFSVIVSLFILSGMIASTIFFGRNFFHKLNPQVIFTSSPTGNFPYYELNSTNFFVAAALTDFGRKPLALDESYYSISFRYIEHLTENGNETWIVTNLNSTPCNQINISNSFYYDLNSKTNFLDGYICPMFDSITVGGDPSQPIDNWIDVIITDCVNSTSPVICKSNSEIKNFFHDKHFILNTLDHFTTVDDYDSPIKEKRSFFIKYISYQFYQAINLLYENLTVTTDAGLVFQSMSQHSSFSIKEKINDLSIYPDETIWPRTLVQYTLKITNSVSEYKRNYMKAQELSAFIGGIFSIYLLIGKCLVFIVTDNFFYQNLIDSFFSFEHEKISFKNNSVNFDQSQIHKNIYLTSINENKINDVKILTYHNKSANYYEQFLDKNKINWCDVFCFSFYCRRGNKKFEIFSRLKEEIEKSLEVTRKIKFYKELELLSSYLLNKHEIAALNCQNHLLIQDSSEDEKIDKIRIDQMVDYFKEKIKYNSLNEKDKLLLKSLKNNFLEKILN